MIISIALAILPVGAFIQQKQKINLICEKYILEAQEHLVSGEEKLMQLNPMVQVLVIEKKALELAIRMAPTPAEKAALATQLVFLLLKIKSLRARQLLIIKTHELLALKSNLRLRQSTRAQVRDFERSWKAPPLSPTVNTTSAKFKLLEVRIDPTISIYEAPPLLGQLQTLSAEIHIRGERLFPHWLQFLRTKKIYWQESCQSHPKKGALVWESHLGAGKFF